MVREEALKAAKAASNAIAVNKVNNILNYIAPLSLLCMHLLNSCL